MPRILSEWSVNVFDYYMWLEKLFQPGHSITLNVSEGCESRIRELFQINGYNFNEADHNTIVKDLIFFTNPETSESHDLVIVMAFLDHLLPDSVC